MMPMTSVHLMSTPPTPTSASGGHDGGTNTPGLEPPQQPKDAPPTAADPESSTTAQDPLEQLQQRRYSEAAAALLLAMRTCEECNDPIGKDRHDGCECPCHCKCCCEGFFRCFENCTCECACHYDPTAPAPEATTSDEIVPATPTSACTSPITMTQKRDEDVDMSPPHREPAQGPTPLTSVSTDTAKGKQENADEDMGEPIPTAPQKTPAKIHRLTYVQYYEQLKRWHSAMDDGTQPSNTAEEINAAYFSKLYQEIISTGQKPKAGTEFPHTTADQQVLLTEYANVLLTNDYVQPRFHNALKVVILAMLKSTWTFERILKDRLATATAPKPKPFNVWTSGQEAASQAAALAADMETFRFDTSVFTEERILHLRKVCAAELPFAETCRAPTDDEWSILLGIMNGTILIRALPQFIKRCCNLAQINWVHQQMVLQAEGELLITLPVQATIYDYNQSSKRLAEKLTKDAAYQNWTDPEVARMIQATKTITYNHEIKALHFHFFTKKEAIQWEGMEIPIGTKQAKLSNPDAKYREIKTAADGSTEIVYTAPADGLADDRYQGQYRFRVTNVTRTMEIDKLAQYLQIKTNNAIKMSMPLDTYGPASEWSLLWDFYAHKTTCPPELAKINRIMWRDHALLILHKMGKRNAPCHQCARIGHEAVACTVPQAEWLKENTLVVTDDEIRAIKTERAMWRSPDEAKATFLALGQPPAATTTVSITQQPMTPAAETADPATNNTPASVPVPEPVPAREADPAPAPAPTPDPAPHSSDPSQTTTSTATAALPTTSSGAIQPTATIPPPAPSNPQHAPEPAAQEWLTNVAKFTKRRSTATGAKPASIAPRNHKKQTKPKTTNTYSALEHKDEAEEEPEGEPQPETPATSDATTTPVSEDNKKPTAPVPPATKTISRSKPYKKAEDADSVAAAVHRADMERLGHAILAAATRHGRSIDHDALAHHLNASMQHATDSASKAWVLNALSAIKDAGAADTHVELTTLMKYAMYHGTLVDADLERTQANPAAILDFATGSPANRTTDELHAAMEQYYKDIATSSSELHQLLPVHLWGGTDTLRMAAKVLQRQIHIVWDTADPTNVQLMTIVPQRLRDVPTRTQFLSATVQQPGLKNWFIAIQQDLKNRQTPLVLHYTGNHYNSILLQPASTTQRRSNPTKATKMTDHWNANEGTIHRAGSPPAGPTRLELVSSQSSVTSSDILRALAQDNWNRHDKKTAIDAMVLDPPRLKELLAITSGCNDNSDAEMTQASDETEIQLAQDAQTVNASDTQENLSGSQYSPSPTSSSAEHYYALPSPSQEDGAYATWSQQEWERVVQEWAEQDGQLLPPLTDPAAIAKFAASQPTVMTELAKWYANPFVLLDHFTDEAIKGWMAAKRMRYCLRQLELVINTVTQPSHRAVLDEWLRTITTADSMMQKTVTYRDGAKWSLLREAAPTHLKGPGAVPFLSINYAKEFAYVLVLDDLFPSLGRHIIHHEGKDQPGAVELPYVYRESPTFRAALKTSMEERTWTPVERFIQSLLIDPVPAPPRC